MQPLVTHFVRLHINSGNAERVEFNESHAMSAHTDIFEPRFPGDAHGIPRQAAMELVNRWNAGTWRMLQPNSTAPNRWVYYIEQ